MYLLFYFILLLDYMFTHYPDCTDTKINDTLRQICSDARTKIRKHDPDREFIVDSKVLKKNEISEPTQARKRKQNEDSNEQQQQPNQRNLFEYCDSFQIPATQSNSNVIQDDHSYSDYLIQRSQNINYSIGKSDRGFISQAISTLDDSDTMQYPLDDE
jgi:hypothetical protein